MLGSQAVDPKTVVKIFRKSRRSVPGSNVAKLAAGSATDWTAPVPWQVFKIRPRCDGSITISLAWFVDIAAGTAFIAGWSSFSQGLLFGSFAHC